MYTASADILPLGAGLTETININTDRIIMKTIAILALTAAALVSCQQQQQQQVTETTTTVVTVTPTKK